MCVDNEDVDARNGCASDDECLESGSEICDKDPDCFGVAWNKNRLEQPLKICRSRLLVDDPNGGRTILKGMYWQTRLRLWGIA